MNTLELIGLFYVILTCSIGSFALLLAAGLGLAWVQRKWKAASRDELERLIR